jgi:hypothetical protein
MDELTHCRNRIAELEAILREIRGKGARDRYQPLDLTSVQGSRIRECKASFTKTRLRTTSRTLDRAPVAPP